MKVLVVSGFLGAGKTTFIRELARHIEAGAGLSAASAAGNPVDRGPSGED